MFSILHMLFIEPCVTQSIYYFCSNYRCSSTFSWYLIIYVMHLKLILICFFFYNNLLITFLKNHFFIIVGGNLIDGLHVFSRSFFSQNNYNYISSNISINVVSQNTNYC